MMHLPLMPAAELVAWELDHTMSGLAAKFFRKIGHIRIPEKHVVYDVKDGTVSVELIFRDRRRIELEEDISEFPSKTLLAKILLVAG